MSTSHAYEQRPVIGMIALIWAALMLGTAAHLASGLLQVVSMVGLAALLVFYRAIESRGGMFAVAVAAHPGYRRTAMISAIVPVAGIFFAAGTGGDTRVFFSGLVLLAIALTAWHFAPGARSRSTALGVQ